MSSRRRIGCLSVARLSLLLASGSFLATIASASDGIREINAVCAVQTGCFSGDGAGFPVTIDGSAGHAYRLTSDLSVPNENTHALLIASDGISLDLAGFEIRGPVSCGGNPTVCTPAAGTGSGVRDETFAHFGISVSNGSIRGMGQSGVVLGFESEVTRLRVRSSGGIGIFASFGSTVTASIAYQNGGDGIVTSGGATLSGNTAILNGDDGFRTGDGVTFLGNTSHDNGEDGFDAGVGVTLSANTAYSNGSDGIQTGAGCTVEGNTLRSNNGAGLNLGTQSGYRENVLSSNTGGTVLGTGLVNLGNNACNGLAACP